MSIDHETADPYYYDPADLEGLPSYQGLGGGLSEYNTQYSSDVVDIINSAASEGDRLAFTVFDETNNLAYDLFEGGISADYLRDQMNENGWDVEKMVEFYTNGKIDGEDIGYFQIHESYDRTDLV